MAKTYSTSPALVLLLLLRMIAADQDARLSPSLSLDDAPAFIIL